jgi:hypothetical protein
MRRLSQSSGERRFFARGDCEEGRMSTNPDLEHQQQHHHHRNRHLAQRFENLIGILMVIAIAILAIGLVYGILQTGSTPSYLK